MRPWQSATPANYFILKFRRRKVGTSRSWPSTIVGSLFSKTSAGHRLETAFAPAFVSRALFAAGAPFCDSRAATAGAALGRNPATGALSSRGDARRRFRFFRERRFTLFGLGARCGWAAGRAAALRHPRAARRLRPAAHRIDRGENVTLMRFRALRRLRCRKGCASSRSDVGSILP
jgi:hypothetical protein